MNEKESKRKAGRSPEAKNVIQLKVSLDFIEPEIWRRIAVPDYWSLGDLHRVIQISMGWHNCHLHRFEIDGLNYTFGDAAPEMNMEDEETTILQDVLEQEGRSVLYEYDFGDSWLHKITVERIAPAESASPAVICLAGERACPPEDCGSYPGYEEILFALDAGDPDEEQKSLLEWLEGFYGDYDPESFDLNAVNGQLQDAGGRK